MCSASPLAIVILSLVFTGQVNAHEGLPAPIATAGKTAAGFLPVAFDPQEHASTWANPPFSRRVLPRAVGPKREEPPIWDGWEIAAVDKFGGRYTVGLVTKDHEFRLIEEDETHDAERVTLQRVESNGVITDTIVHLAGGGRTGTLKFDQKRLAVVSNVPNQLARTTRQRPVPRSAARSAVQAQVRERAERQLRDHLDAANARAATPAPSAPQTRRRPVVLPPSR